MGRNITKILLFAILASSFAWAFIESGMAFAPIRCGEGCFGFLPIAALILSTLQPILSVIPKALFSLAESLPLLWPFIVGTVILKYLLIAILASLPFFGFYFLARGISDFDRKKIKKGFAVVYFLLILVFISTNVLEIDLTTIAVAKSMDKICENDSGCKSVLYSKISKNTDTRQGLRMPSLTSLRTDYVLEAFVSLPESFREAYCENVYGPLVHIPAERTKLNSCKEKLDLTDNRSPLWEDCLAQTDSYSVQIPSLIDSCVQSFIHINPIDIPQLKLFLEPIKYSNKYRQNDNAYTMDSKMNPRLTNLDNTELALRSVLQDHQPLHAFSLSITQINPELFQKYVDGNWSPVNNFTSKDRDAKRLSFEQKIISDTNVVEEHLQSPAYANSDLYRIGFLVQNIFILVEARGDRDSDETRESAERLARHIIEFL